MSRAEAAAPDPWADAVAAVSLLAVDPVGAGGVSLRSPPGLVRDRWLALLRAVLPPPAPLRKVPLGIAEGRLLGGLDLGATLRAGRPAAERGILAEADGGVVLLAMAERLPAATAARIAAVLDSGEVAMSRDGTALRSAARIGVVALDEGIEDERTPAALLDRLAFHVDLPGLPADAGEPLPGPDAIAAARVLLPSVQTDDAVLEALCATAMTLGIASVRAPLLAVRVARAAAALAGRIQVSPEDAVLAGRLVLAPRATVLPSAPPPADDMAEPPTDAKDQPPRDDPADDTSDDPSDDAEDDAKAAGQPLSEMLLEAAIAALPAGLLAQLKPPDGGQVRARSTGKAGALRNAGRRGRPAGVRAGDLREGLRLNVIETLRAAAPWQRIRQRAEEPMQQGRVEIRRDDFRVTRLKPRAETTTIFVVDASGSSALNRLAEAKGAVELLLADCYIRRDQVAVLAFRGRDAQVLLPPTRSLVRAKRSLAELPGGGGTPLAAGIDAGYMLADAVRRRGGTPSIVLLTDGQANVAQDGRGGRARAEQDALGAARRLRAARFGALWIDTSPRRQPASQRLAAEMGARYVALPYANAAALSRVVRAASDRP